MPSPATRTRSIRLDGLWLCLCGVLIAGCKSVESGTAAFVQSPDGQVLQRDEEDAEEVYRRRFQTSGDPEAMRWLLAHRLETGMPLADVSRILGSDGVREVNDRWLKTHGGHYRTGDAVYRWGPDNAGKSVYLVFRNGHLVNFDKSEYR